MISNASAVLVISLMGVAVMAPVAADKFSRSSKGNVELAMPTNDDFSSTTVMFSTAGGSTPPVEGADLAIVLGAWGPCPGVCPADFNGDGVVDGSDLAVVLGAWGPCPL
ncbi:MAG: hypothetical protein EBZ75_13750 [Oxalobacteraceae bacterium]|nr:hypothetical protein [Oxalobacteraceae bacterium]